MRRRVAASLLVICAFLAGCCDKKTRRIRPYWLRTTEGYLLTVERIDQGSQPVLLTKRDVVDTSFEEQGLVGTIGAQHYGFWFELTNKRSKPIRLLWPEARYVDEKGMRQDLFRHPMAALPSPSEMKISQPVTVSASERVHDVITPIYKSSMVASGCKDLISYREPLIPTKLDDKTEHQIKLYVEDLARRQVPVKLFLPIEIEGKRHDYTFTFVLKDWADLRDKEKETSP